MKEKVIRTVVYLGNDLIQRVDETNKKNYLCEEVHLDTGTLINGVFKSTDYLAEQLKDICKDATSVEVVIDSSNILTRTVNVTKLSNKQLIGLMHNEFEDFGPNSTAIRIGTILSKDKANSTIFCSELQKEFVTSYTSLFSNLEIEITSMDTVMSSIFKYIYNSKELKNQTFVFNILSQDTLFSFLFEDGYYIVSNRHKLLNEKGSEDYLVEIHSRLVASAKFHSTRNSDYEILYSFYLGVTEEEFQALEEIHSDYETKITLKHTILNVDFDNFALPILSLEKAKHNIDVIAAIQSNVSKKFKFSVEVALQVVTLVSLVGVFSSYLILDHTRSNLTTQIDVTNAQIAELEKEMEDILNGEDYKPDILEETKALTSALNYVTETNYQVSDMFRYFAKYLDLTSISYASASGNVTFSMQTYAELGSAEAVTDLRETEFFSDLKYNSVVNNSKDSYTLYDSEGSSILYNSHLVGTKAKHSIASILLRQEIDEARGTELRDGTAIVEEVDTDDVESLVTIDEFGNNSSDNLKPSAQIDSVMISNVVKDELTDVVKDILVDSGSVDLNGIIQSEVNSVVGSSLALIGTDTITSMIRAEIETAVKEVVGNVSKDTLNNIIEDIVLDAVDSDSTLNQTIKPVASPADEEDDEDEEDDTKSSQRGGDDD